MYKFKQDFKQVLLQEDQAIFDDRSTVNLMEKKQYDLIDLFCGAGGMTLGFSDAFNHNFRPVWANDFNKYCIETYNQNFGDHGIYGDLVDILKDKTVKIPKADIVIGGPPCQGFSLLNRKRINDPRRQLWRPYLEVVERSNAKIFVIENVPQLLGTNEHGEIVASAQKMGFKMWSGKMCSANYGVPQLRWRAVIVGSKKCNPAYIFPPRGTHYKQSSKATFEDTLLKDDEYLIKLKPWNTVRDAIGNLPVPVGTEIRNIKPPFDLHFGRTPTEKSLKRYKAIPKEGMNRFDLLQNAPEITPKCWKRKKSGGTDLFGRMWWDRPSVTIRTEFYKPEKGRYLHPQQHRPITLREAARLQSFPDSFVFKGTKIEIAKQIGNAVPPLMAARIADCVYTMLSVSEGNRGCIQKGKKKLDNVAC